MKLVIFLSILSFLFSCKKDVTFYRGNMSGAAQIEIIGFQKPDTVMNYSLNEIHVKAMAWDGCYYDLTFEYDSINNFEYSIKAFAKFSNLSGSCPQILVTKDTIIEFKPIQSGIYIFDIYSSQDKIIIDSINVF